MAKLKGKQKEAPAGASEATQPSEGEVNAIEDQEEASTDQETLMVKVENLTGGFLRQFTTGITIKAKSTALMADDPWLQMQIRAKLLKKV